MFDVHKNPIQRSKKKCAFRQGQTRFLGIDRLLLRNYSKCRGKENFRNKIIRKKKELLNQYGLGIINGKQRIG